MSSTRRSRIKVETLFDFPLNGFDVTEAMSSFNNDNGESYRSTSANNNNNNNNNRRTWTIANAQVEMNAYEKNGEIRNYLRSLL